MPFVPFVPSWFSLFPGVQECDASKAARSYEAGNKKILIKLITVTYVKLDLYFMTKEMQQQHLKILNQVFELEKKIRGKDELVSLQRNIDRIKKSFEELGLSVYNPQGEPYNETRTDVEASISGDSTKNLQIINVIKPIVYEQNNGSRALIQKGVVIVESKR